MNKLHEHLKNIQFKNEFVGKQVAINRVERLFSDLEDELETLHAAYGNAQKEISDLKSHNDTLIKRVKRLESRSEKLGRELLMCKNELRNPNVDEDVWKQYNKANRRQKSEGVEQLGYKPLKGFFDISKKPKSLSKREHKKLQGLQMFLSEQQNQASYLKKHDPNQWEKAKEMSAQVQQIIFRHWRNRNE